jgi:hypothetical protein
MSLRTFHILFISFVSLFCLGVAIWALYIEKDNRDIALSVLGYSCAFASICLPIYAVSFSKKSASNFN